jgi:hypothetical protein
VMVVLVGMPLLLLELGLGQKLRLGAAAAWPKVRAYLVWRSFFSKSTFPFPSSVDYANSHKKLFYYLRVI